MATYYKDISVRDQLLSAQHNSKCDFEFGIPKNIKGLHINGQWTAQCSDPCTLGFCEVNIFVFIPGILVPQTVYLIYREGQPIAHVYFNPEVLDILQVNKIIEPAKLQIDKNASKVLPSTLH
jgi:hypothetical protein